MFYSKDILARRDSSFGLVWYAATMGPRSSLGRLSKRELSNVDIVKTCRDISQPAEALALRLSSNLMYGVTRVYGHQVNIVYVDANHTWTQIKRGTSILRMEEVDLAQSGAKFEAITFQDAPNIEDQVLQNIKSGKLSHDMELEQARKSATNLAVEFGWALAPVTGNMSQASEASSSSTSHLGGANLFMDMDLDNHDDTIGQFLSSTNEQRRRITLNEELVLNRHLQAARHRDRALGLGPDDDELLGGAGDDGLYFDAEGNLLATENYPQAAEMSVVEGKKRKRDEMEGLDGDGGFEMGFAAGEQALTELLSMDDEDGIVPALQAPPSAMGSRRLKTGSRAWRLMVDDPTMLTRDDIQQMRTRLAQDQTEALRTQQQKQMIQRMREFFDAGVVGPISLHGYGADLTEFWRRVATRQHARVGTVEAQPLSLHRGTSHDDAIVAEMPGYATDEEPELIRRQRHQATADTASFGLSTTHPDVGAGGSSAIVPWHQERHLPPSTSSSSDRGKDRATVALSEFERAFDQAGGAGVGEGLGAGGGGVGGISSSSSGSGGSGGAGPSHPRHRRWPKSGTSTPTGRHSRPGSPRTAAGAAGDMDWALLFKDTGGGVGGTMSRGATPPPFEGLWPAGDEGGSSGGSGTPTTTTTTARARERDRGMIVGPAAAGETQHGGGDGGGSITAAATESTLVDRQGLEVTVERETASFWRYIQSILQDAKASSFHFSDVVTPHQKRAVAAAAFYHVLALSTKGFLKPLQSEPYQDIHVVLV